MTKDTQVFLSYSSEDIFEADLLQYVAENMLADLKVTLWAYHRDQARDQRSIAGGVRDMVRRSAAMIFLASRSTLDVGSTQWMELAYADAFGLPIFIILHRTTVPEIRTRLEHVPPLMLEANCNPSHEWRQVVSAVRSRLTVPRVRKRRS